jgi:hypothetical protein
MTLLLYNKKRLTSAIQNLQISLISIIKPGISTGIVDFIPYIFKFSHAYNIC